MPEVLATWDNFAGGHWGNLGPSAAPDSSYGGVNMVVGADGTVVPVNSSRWFQLNATINGKVWGMFWAWGADGYIYYLQQAGTQTSVSRIYRFNPDITTLPNTISTNTVFSFVPTTDPDWVEVGATVYVTIYGQKTYAIGTSGNTNVVLTGSYGDAPAGRCIAVYGDRLMVGGISGNTNRIRFSGDDTNNITYDRTAWESTNFFDIGTDGDTVVGLYNLRDYLVAILDDQSIYLINGTPNVNLSARRVYGFNKGSGGLTAFLPSHAAVDPSQTRLWMFDHANRAPVRFNGSTMSRIPQFGAPHLSRTGTDLVEGQLAMIGGPDEFVCHGVAVGRNAGEATVDHRLELVKIRGIYSLVQNDVIASRQ